LSYAELDAPVIASAIFHHTVTTAFYRPVFAGQGMGAPVTLRTQHGGINPCMSEGSPDSICTPLRQLHVGGWTVNAMSIATYLNYRSSWQLFDQTGGLPQKRLAARQNLGTIGTEINGREFKGRLTQNTGWVFVIEARSGCQYRRRVGRAAVCDCAKYESRPKGGF
jgi:hypothetical protein